MNKQSEKIQKMAQVIAQNQNLPIVCLVDTDVQGSNELGKWLGYIGNTYVGRYGYSAKTCSTFVENDGKYYPEDTEWETAVIINIEI